MKKLIFQLFMYRRIVFYPFYSHTCSLEQDTVGKWLKYCRYNVNRLVIIKSTFWNCKTEDLRVYDEYFSDNLRHFLLYLGRRKTYFIFRYFLHEVFFNESTFYIVFAYTGVNFFSLMVPSMYTCIFRIMINIFALYFLVAIYINVVLAASLFVSAIGVTRIFRKITRECKVGLCLWLTATN